MMTGTPGAVGIMNITRNTRIAESTEFATTAVRRFTGLMFRKGTPAGFALILEPCSGIHTCFMRFPVDVLFVSTGWKVIQAFRAVPPWRFIPLVRGARRVIELPAGAINASSTCPGDTLLLADALPGQGT